MRIVHTSLNVICFGDNGLSKLGKLTETGEFSEDFIKKPWEVDLFNVKNLDNIILPSNVTGFVFELNEEVIGEVRDYDDYRCKGILLYVLSELPTPVSDIISGAIYAPNKGSIIEKCSKAKADSFIGGVGRLVYPINQDKTHFVKKEALQQTFQELAKVVNQTTVFDNLNRKAEQLSKTLVKKS